MIYAYYRKSTSSQELSIERQRVMIDEWAAAKGVVVDRHFIEEPVSGSAKLKDRPALADLISIIDKGDVLICSDLTRLSRKNIVFNMILGLVHNAEARVEFADGHQCDADDLMSMLMTSILAFTSQWEREQIATRTKQALAIAKRTKALGRADRCEFGYRNIDGQKVPHEKEQYTGRLIQSLRRQGIKLKDIKDRLTNENIFTRTGREYSIAGISQLNKSFVAAVDHGTLA